MAFAGLAFLMCITVYSADDFWYSTFLSGSLEHFLELTRLHYETFNGRVLVHIVAQVILHFGTWFFALFGTVCLIGIPAAAHKAAGRPKAELVTALAIFAVCVLALPRELLVQGLLWISAFCNYALPTAMIALELLLLTRTAAEGKTRFGSLPLCALTGFLCGATTEQSGFTAIAAAGLVWLWCLFKNRRKLAYPTAAALFAAAGLLTVFLSPATRDRFLRETDAGTLSGLFSTMRDGLNEQAALLFSGRAAAILIAVLFAAAGLALMRSSGKKLLPLGAAGLSMAAAVLLPAFSGDTRGALYGALLALILLWAVALIALSRRTEGFLLILSLVSILVMLPTESVGGRVFLPAFLYAAAAAALLMAGELEAMRSGLRGALPLLAAVGVIVLRLPFFAGCLDNLRIDRLNSASAEEAHTTGVLYYCIDYDMDYTHFKASHDAYFRGEYLESKGLPEDTKVYFYGENKLAVYVLGERLTSPAFPDGEGGWMIPLRAVIEPLGGSLELTSTGVIVRINGVEVQISYPFAGEAHLEWTDAGGEAHTMDVPKLDGYAETVIGERAYTDVFGLDVRMSEDGTRIDVG